MYLIWVYEQTVSDLRHSYQTLATYSKLQNTTTVRSWWRGRNAQHCVENL